MNYDDIIYLLCLLTCVGFGQFYRKLNDIHTRKLIGTTLGTFIVFIVSGFHILHCLISFLICAIIITTIHPKKCHLITFVFMFSYLVFFRTTTYFGIPNPPGHTNMIQMILTLKIIGLAFEKNSAYTRTTENKDIEISDYDKEILNVNIVELFHYSFNYIGVLTGPYFRYRTFRDFFHTPFKNYANCFEITVDKLKSTLLYSSIFLLTNYYWPLTYALSDEFYQERSLLYRLMYVWPLFVIFRMRIYIGLTLSEAVCSNAGFGAYPDVVAVAHGEGPKEDYLHLTKNPETLKYNFSTIQNIDVYNTETCWTFREAMKHWNICVQYWLAVNVYKRFPSKKYRTLVTLFVSAFWHGFYPGHYFCIMGAPFYIPVEDILNKHIRKDATGTIRSVIDILFWISKFFAFSYLGISFQLLTFDKIWKYYSSVYYLGYLYYVLLLVIAVALQSTARRHNEAKRNN